MSTFTHKIGPVVGLAAVVAFAAYYSFDISSTTDNPAALVQITVGVGASNFPYGYETPQGHAAGFNVDVTQAVCDRLHWQCTVELVPYGELLDKLRSKNIDLVVANLPIDPEQSGIVYSKPYARSGSLLLTTNPEVHGVEPENFRGLTIAAGHGTHQEDIVRNVYVPAGAELLTVTYAHEAYAALENGMADAVLIDTLNGISQLKRTENNKVFPAGIYASENEFPYELRRMAMRAGDKRMKLVNQALTSLKLDGTLQTIFIKHFQLVSL